MSDNSVEKSGNGSGWKVLIEDILNGIHEMRQQVNGLVAAKALDLASMRQEVNAMKDSLQAKMQSVLDAQVAAATERREDLSSMREEMAGAVQRQKDCQAACEQHFSQLKSEIAELKSGLRWKNWLVAVAIAVAVVVTIVDTGFLAKVGQILKLFGL